MITGHLGILLPLRSSTIESGRYDSMVKKRRKMGEKKTRTLKNTGNDPSKRYIMDFMALRYAIIENCRDCIRDCGKDCLDNEAKPMENIRCPLQKVRIDYKMAIKGSNARPQGPGQTDIHKIEIQ